MPDLLTLVDSYYKVKEQHDRNHDEMANLNKQIKDIMAEKNRKHLWVGNYYVKIEEKYEPNRDFVILLKNQGLTGFVGESCSMPDFRRACKMLGIDEIRQERYLDKKTAQWLYVKKSSGNRNYHRYKKPNFFISRKG